MPLSRAAGINLPRSVFEPRSSLGVTASLPGVAHFVDGGRSRRRRFRRRAPRTNAEWALLGSASPCSSSAPHALAGDDLIRFDDIERLLHDGDLSDSKFSLVMPLASAPFLLPGEVVASPRWWAARFNVIVVAVGLGVGFRLLRRGSTKPSSGSSRSCSSSPRC